MKKKTNVVLLAACLATFGLAALGSGSGGTGASIDNSGATATTEASTPATEATTEAKENIVQVGGSFEGSGLKCTVNGANLDYQVTDDPYGLNDLPEGKKYVSVDFTFENIGESDEYVSIYDFDCYADNAACEQAFLTSETDDDFINTNLSAGRSVSFTTFYTVPTDASEIELEYTSNIWTGEKVIVKLQ